MVDLDAVLRDGLAVGHNPRDERCVCGGIVFANAGIFNEMRL